MVATSLRHLSTPLQGFGTGQNEAVLFPGILHSAPDHVDLGASSHTAPLQRVTVNLTQCQGLS